MCLFLLSLRWALQGGTQEMDEPFKQCARQCVKIYKELTQLSISPLRSLGPLVFILNVRLNGFKSVSARSIATTKLLENVVVTKTYQNNLILYHFVKMLGISKKVKYLG